MNRESLKTEFNKPRPKEVALTLTKLGNVALWHVDSPTLYDVIATLLVADDGADSTRVVFKVIDRYGADRAFGSGEVGFEIDGPGVIVGNNPFSLDGSGGVGAIWIRTIPNACGKVRVVATHSALGAKTVEIDVQPAARV